jgi:GTP pyrophosphokinase
METDQSVQPLLLGERFREALAFAAEAHDGQGRKGTEVPYVAHLLGVTAIVLEYGGDEDQAIAALLHDAIEDQGGDVMRRKILARFGEHVTGMVNDCTDAEVIPKPPWKERKLAYLAHIPAVGADSLLVSMADKLHNSRAILRDLRHQGPSVFERFKGRRDGTLWYYRALVEAFQARAPQGAARDLLDELSHTVREMEQTAAAFDD